MASGSDWIYYNSVSQSIIGSNTNIWQNLGNVNNSNFVDFTHSYMDSNNLYSYMMHLTGNTNAKSGYTDEIYKVELEVKSYYDQGSFKLSGGADNEKMNVIEVWYYNAVSYSSYVQSDLKPLSNPYYASVFIDLTSYGPYAPDTWTWEDVGGLNFNYYCVGLNTSPPLTQRVYYFALNVYYNTPPKLYFVKTPGVASECDLYFSADPVWNKTFACEYSNKKVYCQLDNNLSHTNATSLRTKIGGTKYAFISPSDTS